MAIFGEISEPTSRAVLEYWDKLEKCPKVPKLQWQLKPFQIPKDVGKFFIFEGKRLWAGVKERKAVVEVNFVKEANLYLYKKPNTHNFVAIVKDCNLPMSNAVVRLLKDLITRAKMVVTVQEKPMAEFQTKQVITSSQILRKITTTNKTNLMKEKVSKLEQPNIITGVSAGVFTLREHLGLSATSMVIYIQPQENQVDDIENLMQNMGMTGVSKSTPNVITNSNLYI